MSSIDVLDARRRLVDVGLCEDQSAEPAALLLDDLFDQALSGYVQEATLDGLVDQWRAERAEIAAQQALFLADIRLEMNGIRKEINDFREENSQRERERDERERQRDERERQRDERERQRDSKWEERERERDARDARMRNWVIGAVGLGFAATTLVVGLLVAFG